MPTSTNFSTNFANIIHNFIISKQNAINLRVRVHLLHSTQLVQLYTILFLLFLKIIENQYSLQELSYIVYLYSNFIYVNEKNKNIATLLTINLK